MTGLPDYASLKTKLRALRDGFHDNLSLRVHRGPRKFYWPQTVDGVVAFMPGQMGYLLEGIDWRNPQKNPKSGGPIGRRPPNGSIPRRFTKKAVLLGPPENETAAP